VSAVGDAMAPTVHEGDLLVVDTEDRRLSDGCLYVLQADGEILMRRTARRAGGGLQLLADHPGYADETVPAERIAGLSVVGRAVWLGCPR
jgi:phage repressor protein C with HTH and peptisase S24 domain